ncbi:MAG: LamG-like jellyroll fold domain-containing protein [Verrucomicrobiota bacterium]
MMNKYKPRTSAGLGLLGGLLLAASGQVQGQISNGLVSYWPLDALNGTKTPDTVSFYDMDAANLTADDVVPGKFGNAFSFSNERQTLLSRVHQADDNLPANKHAAHTISMWVNVAGAGQNDLRVFSEGNTTDSNPLFNIGTHNGGADGSVDLYIRQNGWATFGHAYTTQQPFIADEWHHIAWVQEADGSRTMYVDGNADELDITPKEEGDWLVNNTSIGGILRASASHWATSLAVVKLIPAPKAWWPTGPWTRSKEPKLPISLMDMTWISPI